jgi:hypothetical protein
MFVHKGLFRNADGGGAGAGSGGAASPGSGSPPPAAGGDGAAATGVTFPAAGQAWGDSHWKAIGYDDNALVTIKERGWKTPNDQFTSYRNLEKLTGDLNSVVKIPKSGDAKEWEPIYDKLGRPKTPNDYTVKLPEGDKGELATAFKPIFHKAGLSQNQVNVISEAWNAHVKGLQEAQTQQQTTRNAEELAALKTAWKDSYDENLEVVNRAAEALGLEEKDLDVFKSGLGPKRTLELLHKIGSKVAIEDGKPAGFKSQGGNGFKGMSAESAKAALEELRASREHAQMFDSPDPQVRQQAREKVRQLEVIAYPGSMAL